MRRGYVDTPWGQVHYGWEGDGFPLVLLHHTPRSLEFYRPIIPGLAGSRRVIAVDTPGFGNSDPLAGPHSIERYADRIVDFVDRLGLDAFDVFGSNTGAAIAIEIAASRPGRVRRLGVMAPPYFATEASRARALEGVTAAHRASPDGRELLDRWESSVMAKWRWECGRRSGLPGIDEAVALAGGYVSDLLRAGRSWVEGRRAAYAYDPSSKFGAIRVPSLVVGFDGELDPSVGSSEFVCQSEVVASLLTGSRFVRLPGSSSVLAMLTTLEELTAMLDEFFTPDIPT